MKKKGQYCARKKTGASKAICRNCRLAGRCVQPYVKRPKPVPVDVDTDQTIRALGAQLTRTEEDLASVKDERRKYKDRLQIQTELAADLSDDLDQQVRRTAFARGACVGIAGVGISLALVIYSQAMGEQVAPVVATPTVIATLIGTSIAFEKRHRAELLWWFITALSVYGALTTAG